jgi:uncharacterized protein GlcG (DUF336 family)
MSSASKVGRPFLALLLALLVAIASMSCGGAPQTPVTATTSTSTSAAQLLTAADVQQVVQKSAESVDAAVTIAVTDRSGNILAIYEKAGAPATTTGDFGATVSTRELALSLARTASFFSNDQAPLSSRTVRYISGVHFPPGIDFAPNAALYGIENTNRGCPLNVTFLPGQALPPARSADGSTTGLGITTGKPDDFDSDGNAVNPGGVPLFKNGSLVGGVGVAGASAAVTEFAAFSGVAGGGFAPSPAPPGVVIVDGVALPFVNQTTRPAGSSAGLFAGVFVAGPVATAGPTPSGDLIAVSAGIVGSLTAADVRKIIDAAIATANVTRAVIRLPDGQRARFAIAVADLDGHLLGLNRMPDATVFSVDVAGAKARNLAYLSSQQANPADLPGVPLGTAVTNRTISFGAQPFFPPGINGSTPGPFFPLYQFDRTHPCTNGHQPANPNQNGIVFFPGSVPLYKNGVLVGALGISGDGVEQDDFVSAQAAIGFEPPAAIRADQVMIQGVRLPYLKFPRNPTL